MLSQVGFICVQDFGMAFINMPPIKHEQINITKKATTLTNSEKKKLICQRKRQSRQKMIVAPILKPMNLSTEFSMVVCF
jgi:hypothetical protein